MTGSENFSIWIGRHKGGIGNGSTAGSIVIKFATVICTTSHVELTLKGEIFQTNLVLKFMATQIVPPFVKA